MTIGRAMKFIDQAPGDVVLRGELNRASSVAELYGVLKRHDLSFSAFDFEEAFNNRLVNCQFHEQAEHLQEFKLWWETLHMLLGGTSPSSGGGCESVSQCAVSGGCKSCGG